MHTLLGICIVFLMGSLVGFGASQRATHPVAAVDVARYVAGLRTGDGHAAWASDVRESSTMIRQLAVGALALFVLVVLAATFVRWLGLPRAAPAESDVLISEPAPAAVFIAAYAGGDLATADRLASPLYRMQWT